jgi:hypothetical protein
MSKGAEEDEARARLSKAQRAIQRTVREADPERALREDRRAWLADAGFGGDDLEAMARLEDRRILLYRKLVRRGLRAAIRVEIPRSAARLGPAFDAYVARYFEEELPRSRYLRDVAFEFVAWAAPRWASDEAVPSYLADLARHELIAFEVACDPEPPRAPTGLPLDLERPVAFIAAARLARYQHAVHKLDADESARDAPAREPTAMLVYRDADHEVRYLDLTPLAAAILDRLLGGAPLRDAVLGGCAELGAAVDAPVLEGTARLLSDLGDRGVMLGAR